MQRLFVYGTLAPGRVNHHLLEGLSGTWEEATVRGQLVQQGWGAGLGYPGIVLGGEGTEVEGFVFSSIHLADHWAMLDEFEGEGYIRTPVHAKLTQGRVVEAFVYALSREHGSPAA